MKRFLTLAALLGLSFLQIGCGNDAPPTASPPAKATSGPAAAPGEKEGADTKGDDNKPDSKEEK